MSSERIWSIAGKVNAATSITSIAQWRTTKGSTGVLRPVFDALDVPIVQCRWTELNSPK